jgi:hypothetical protein
MDFKIYKKSGKKHKKYTIKEAFDKGYIYLDNEGLHPKDSTVLLLESIDLFDIHKNLLFLGDCLVIGTQMYIVRWNGEECRYGLVSDGVFKNISAELCKTMALAGSIYDGIFDEQQVSITIGNKNTPRKGSVFNVNTLLSNYTYD